MGLEVREAGTRKGRGLGGRRNKNTERVKRKYIAQEEITIGDEEEVE